MMLDKKHTLMIFLLELNMGHKAVETTCNINYALGQLLTNIKCSGDSRGFAKEMRALKMRSIAPSHRKLTMTN